VFEIAETQHLRHEEAARPAPRPGGRPGQQQLGRVRVDRRRITASVPDEVDLKVEVELGDVNELEIELTW